MNPTDAARATARATYGTADAARAARRAARAAYEAADAAARAAAGRDSRAYYAAAVRRHDTAVDWFAAADAALLLARTADNIAAIVAAETACEDAADAIPTRRY